MAAVTAGGSAAQSLHNGAQPRARGKQKGASSFPDVFPGVRALLCHGQRWTQLAEEGVPVPGDTPAPCPSLAGVGRHGCAGRVAGRNYLEEKRKPWFGIAAEAEGGGSVG